MLWFKRNFNEDAFYEKNTKSYKERPIVLDDLVDDFISWYGNNFSSGYTFIDEKKQLALRNFIEKVAVWYELKYPDYEIDSIIPYSNVGFEQAKNISDYITSSINLDTSSREKIFSTKTFINDLSWKEKEYFKRPRYSSLIYWDPENSYAHFHLTSNGFIASFDDDYSEVKFLDSKNLKGKNIKEVVETLKEKGITLPEKNEIEPAIESYEKRLYRKEEMLNCIMYRIIERGGNRVGPRRALLFAQEFNRDISIPLIYGIDSTDPDIRYFINEYLKMGGSKYLVCYLNYFIRQKKYSPLETVILDDELRRDTGYTHEEDCLHQNLVDILARKVEMENAEEELSRKLVKKENQSDNK